MTWETVPLGKVARVDAKAAQPSDIEADTPYVGLEHIGAGGTIDVSTLAGDADLKSAKNRFDARHVLFGKLRPNLGKVARPAVAGVCSTDIYPLLASDRLDRNYLAHYLLTPKAIAFSSSRTSGVNLPRVTWSALSDLPLPLPPLPEQRRIAAILDEADALRSRSAQARSKRRELRSRLLHASFAEAAGVADLGAYISESQNGLYKPQSAYGQGTPIVRIDAFDGVEPGFQGELKRLTISEEERSRFGVRPGDILINRVNALSHLGKSVLVPALREPIVFESNMMRVSLREGGLAPAVVAGWLSTNEARSQIQQRAKKAINQASINQRDVASLQVPALSPRQQSALVERLDGLDASRAASERRIAELDALFASLQHRAFRGEL